MKNSNSGLSLLSGALIGAAAMYILDPEAGSRRRHAIGAKTTDALRGTGDALGDVWGQAQKLGADLISHAHDLSAHVSDRAKAGAAGAAQHFSDVSDQAGDARDAAVHRMKDLRGRAADLGNELLERARQAAGQAGTSAQESAQSLRHRLAHAIDPDHDRHGGHTAGYAGAGLGALALGAAAMYFLDPSKGAERRECAVSQASKCVQETGQLCRLAGQYVMRLWHRSPSETSPTQSPKRIDGERLVQRGRAEIGHLLSNPTQVQLMADSAGVLTLHGRIPAGELDRVLFVLNNIPGVTQVVNRVEIERPTDANGPLTEMSPQVH